MMPWLCPRCSKMNAPWLNQCFCGPTPAPTTEPPHLAVTLPGTPPQISFTSTGSWELKMDDP